MLKQEIMSIHEALGGMLCRLDPHGAELVRQCRRNLVAAAEQAGELEAWLVPLPAVEHPASAGELHAGRV